MTEAPGSERRPSALCAVITISRKIHAERDGNQMTEQKDDAHGNKALIDNLNKQISELKSQVKNAALEMEIMRARMNDLSHEAQKVVKVERFKVPSDSRMVEINEAAQVIEKAILKERRSRRAQSEGTASRESSIPSKIEERDILLVLTLRRKGFYIREIAAHTGLGVGTVHSIIKTYGTDPQMQGLVTEGTQMELSDYLLIRPDDDLI